MKTHTLMEKEILESPKVVRRFIARQFPKLLKIAAALRLRSFRSVVIVARGSSDNAGVYAKYLIGKYWGMPVALAAPSLHTLYKSTIHYQGSLVIAISQSGQGPDTCEVVRTARQQGALTVGFTNTPGSRLTREAEWSVLLEAGKERSTAATKTYTVELVALYALVRCYMEGSKALKDVHKIPGLLEQGCRSAQAVWDVAPQLLHVTSCAVVGRCFHYGLAMETALKLKECAQVMAHAYSTADFHHGPKALAGRGFPVILLASKGPALKGCLELARELKTREAHLTILSPDASALKLASIPLKTPSSSEELNPLAMAPVIQTLALSVAVLKGLDPDKMIALKKITQTL